MTTCNQIYHPWFDYFRIDVHGCTVNTALKVVTRHVEDCYRYGIPFLEIVHGSGDKATEQRRKGIAEIIQNEFYHAQVAKKIPLSEYGYRYLISEQPRATRLRLKRNPSPLARQESVVFKGFTPEYAQTRYRYASPDWVTGAPDLYPFRPVEVNVFDVQKALAGSPLSPKEIPGKYDYQYLPPHEVVRNAVANVIGESRLDVLDWKFSLTPEQFKGVRSFFLGGLIPPNEIAEALGCDWEFLKFCSSFAYAAESCKCIRAFKAGQMMNFINDDGDCGPMASYQPGSEKVVASLWAAYGAKWKTSRREDEDDPQRADSNFLYSVLPTHCAGKRCGCLNWWPCRKGDPDKSDPGFFDWLFGSRG